MTDRYPACAAFTRKEEGGFSDDPRDPGKATMQGVTIATFRHWRHDPLATVAQLRGILPAEWNAIMASGYWQPPRCQELPPGVDLMVFDMAVNSGPRASAQLLQQAAHVAPVDGWVGPGTLAAVRAMNPADVLDRLARLQEAFYRRLAGFGTFGKGWLARLDRRVRASRAALIEAPVAMQPQQLHARPVEVVDDQEGEADRLNQQELDALHGG